MTPYGRIHIGHLNITGWTSTNNLPRQSIVKKTNFDILGLCETHIGRGDSFQIQLESHVTISHNDRIKKKDAPYTSGGVAILLHRRVLGEYKIANVGKFPDTMTVELTHKENNHTILVAECYVSPERSSYGKDPETFFIKLEELIYEKTAQIGDIVVLGDFNARTGNLLDYNEGVDYTIDRQNLDVTVSGHGLYD